MRRELNDHLRICSNRQFLFNLLDKMPVLLARRIRGARFRCIPRINNPNSALRPAPLTPLNESAMMPFDFTVAPL